MHELSIVSALIEQCEDEARKNEAKEIDEIYVKIGRLSGVEVDLFQRTFDTFKLDSSFCKNSKLILNVADLEVSCPCGYEGVLKENVFFCPSCKGRDLKVIDGEELYLMSLTMY